MSDALTPQQRLEKAVLHLDVAAVHQALAEGANPNGVTEEDGHPLVMAAVFTGGPVDEHEHWHDEGERAGMMARQDQIVEALFKAGASGDASAVTDYKHGDRHSLVEALFQQALTDLMDNDDSDPEAHIQRLRQTFDAGAPLTTRAHLIFLGDHPPEEQSLMQLVDWTSYNIETDDRDLSFHAGKAVPHFMREMVTLLVEKGWDPNDLNARRYPHAAGLVEGFAPLVIEGMRRRKAHDTPDAEAPARRRQRRPG